MELQNEPDAAEKEYKFTSYFPSIMHSLSETVSQTRAMFQQQN